MAPAASKFRAAIVRWRDHQDAIRAVRRVVFIDEQKVSEALEIDPQDHRHTHALAHDHAGNAIATGRLVLGATDTATTTATKTPTAQIGRMAVLPAWRGHGVGSAILHHLTTAAAAHGVQRLSLHAQCHAQSFYTAHGYTPTGAEFLEANIPHIKMTRPLSPPPPPPT